MITLIRLLVYAKSSLCSNVTLLFWLCPVSYFPPTSLLFNKVNSVICTVYSTTPKSRNETVTFNVSGDEFHYLLECNGAFSQSTVPHVAAWLITMIYSLILQWFEPRYGERVDIAYAYANSKGSGEPAHPLSLASPESMLFAHEIGRTWENFSHRTSHVASL